MRTRQSEPDSGQATVELALVMPLIIGLLRIILTVGLVVRDPPLTLSASVTMHVQDVG